MKKEILILRNPVSAHKFRGVQRFLTSLTKYLKNYVIVKEITQIPKKVKENQRFFVPSFVVKKTYVEQTYIFLHDINPYEYNPFYTFDGLFKSELLTVYKPWEVMGLIIRTGIKKFETIQNIKIINTKKFKILVPSKNTAEDFLKAGGKVTPCIVYEGVDTELFSPGLSKKDLNNLGNFNLKKENYVLYVGAVTWQKNIYRLIKAYIDSKLKIPLVITGRVGRVTERNIKKIFSTYINKTVFFTGPVDDAVLLSLYRGAKFFIFPSLYEGFGLPPLEAAACGKAVALSNTSSMPEIMGDAAVYFNPFSTDEIKDAIIKLHHDDRLREKLETSALKRAQQFSWEKIIRNYLEAFEI